MIKLAIVLADAVDLLARVFLRDDAVTVGPALLALIFLARRGVGHDDADGRDRESAPRGRSRSAETSVASGGFSALEVAVINLARGDPLSSVGPRSRLERVVNRILGAFAAPPLADARLEALRCFAVLAWRGRAHRTGSALQSFLAAGFTVGDGNRLLAVVSGGCLDDPAVSAKRLPAALGVADHV